MQGDVSRKFECVHRTVHGDSTTLNNILNTCEEMLQDRGFVTVERVSDVHTAIAQNDFVIRGKDSTGTTCIYITAEKIGIKLVRAIIEKSHGCVVLVSLDGPTPFARKECGGQNVQFMLARELCYNITRHKLVPKHTVAAAPNGISAEQLPRILETDPIVQYYNWPVGTIVRVERCYAGHEPIPYYRCVTSSSS